MYIYIYK